MRRELGEAAYTLGVVRGGRGAGGALFAAAELITVSGLRPRMPVRSG
ncbi:hypothetical protein ACE1OC_38305 [Streptomyces sp. DSM 116496]